MPMLFWNYGREKSGNGVLISKNDKQCIFTYVLLGCEIKTFNEIEKYCE